MSEELKSDIFEWMIANPSVRKSPVGSDEMWIENGDGEHVRSHKHLLEISICGLHDNLIDLAIVTCMILMSRRNN